MNNIVTDGTNSVTIPTAVISSLLKLGDGNAALLYLHLMRGGDAIKTSADIIRDLGWDAHTLEVAENRLIFAGIMPDTGDEAIRQAIAEPTEVFEERPRRAEARGTAEADGRFYALVQEIQRLLGKVLSSDEMIRLLGIYDTLQLPGEVILQLVSYCMSETEKPGESRAPSMRYIEKAAYTWEREGIFTLEAAEQYIKQHELRRGDIAQLRRVLGITDHEMLPSERKYIESWLTLGYDAETIAMAYERMIMKTGKLVWRYMDAIIVNWHEKGLHTVAEILEKDAKSDKSEPSRNIFATRPAPDKSDVARMERFLENMKKAND